MRGGCRERLLHPIARCARALHVRVFRVRNRLSRVGVETRAAGTVNYSCRGHSRSAKLKVSIKSVYHSGFAKSAIFGSICLKKLLKSGEHALITSRTFPSLSP